MFDHCLYFNTTALARVLEREWTRAFKPFGLTPSQAFMLRAVLARPGLLQSELARELVISRPTATRSLDGLQKLQLIGRRATGGDGRECAVFPEPAARAMHDELNAASGAVTARLKQLLEPEQFAAIVGALKQARSAVA
ncbi:MarR family transcriptional regulator [Massilia sp. CCM 8695]|uniref:MarR family transcriptional regulator n=1 Tax=Massilia frigida TaxID=2609281 RepID=A0ABX0NJ41_9BURK|nr:MarR family transcriptional regulator [Massilia frigida]NHZ82730.1 MarR family transcriptional regulator [Massilia frigida]